jgi:zinc and cadmium transporter
MKFQLITYSFLVFITALAGGVIPLFWSRLHDEGLKTFVCLGAGILLGMSFLHMLPEASELLPRQFGFWFLVGFLILLILERFVMVHPCDEHGCHYHTVGVAAFAGLTIHGIIEGFALASSLFVSRLAPFVLVAILAHKAPQGFALTSILKLAGKTKRQILSFAVGVALSGPLGVVLAYSLIGKQQMPSMAGVLLSVSSGTFMYIGACDLLPELHRVDDQKFKRLIAFLVGIGISAISGFLVDGHSR